MASSKKRRSPFPERTSNRMPAEEPESILADDPSPGVFGFFRSLGVRETIESLVIAIVLALLFRAYEAEAFIIPTGSMAPSLNGQHLDLPCENCGHQFHVGGKEGVEHYAVFCPICNYETILKQKSNPSHQLCTGDRILVNKFIYDFSDPQRYDVIVFKNPNQGKQNYIKRLIGLPGDNILIENGDIYLMKPDAVGWKKEITRKPHHKLRHILQTVDDTDHIGRKLKEVDWPSRWQSFADPSHWEMEIKGGHPEFRVSGGGEKWLRYRHFQPLKSEWPTIEGGELPARMKADPLPPGELIGDKYGYNDWSNSRNDDVSLANPGVHWVGDIGLECWIEVKSNQGEVIFDAVEGGCHFRCVIDVASGKATLVADDANVDTKVTFVDESGGTVASPTASTNLRGAGSYHVRYVNADDQIHLWINHRYIDFDAATYQRAGIPVPTYSPADPGDAEPLGVGSVGAELVIDRLKVVRDIYYISKKGESQLDSNNEIDYLAFNAEWNSPHDARRKLTTEMLALQRNPNKWASPEALAIFTEKKGATKPMFELLDSEDNAKDQFLPMGDNSPQSLDGRVWGGPNYVERDLLIGRALFIYWPHMLNEPAPMPNFGEMGFIR